MPLVCVCVCVCVINHVSVRLCAVCFLHLILSLGLSKSDSLQSPSVAYCSSTLQESVSGSVRNAGSAITYSLAHRWWARETTNLNYKPLQLDTLTQGTLFHPVSGKNRLEIPSDVCHSGPNPSSSHCNRRSLVPVLYCLSWQLVTHTHTHTHGHFVMDGSIVSTQKKDHASAPSHKLLTTNALFLLFFVVLLLNLNYF